MAERCLTSNTLFDQVFIQSNKRKPRNTHCQDVSSRSPIPRNGISYVLRRKDPPSQTTIPQKTIYTFEAFFVSDAMERDFTIERKYLPVHGNESIARVIREYF